MGREHVRGPEGIGEEGVKGDYCGLYILDFYNSLEDGKHIII